MKSDFLFCSREFVWNWSVITTSNRTGCYWLWKWPDHFGTEQSVLFGCSGGQFTDCKSWPKSSPWTVHYEDLTMKLTNRFQCYFQSFQSVDNGPFEHTSIRRSARLCDGIAGECRRMLSHCRLAAIISLDPDHCSLKLLLKLLLKLMWKRNDWHNGPLEIAHT